METLTLDADQLNELAVANLAAECISDLRIVDNDDSGDTLSHIVKVPPATPEQLETYYAHDHQFLCTQVRWAGMNIGDRVNELAAWDMPASLAMQEDILDVFTEDAKRDVVFWQQQINSGAVWHAPGGIGRLAHQLIELGYLLWSKNETTSYYNTPIPTRTNAPERQGTVDHVRATMSPAYADWLAAI